MVLLDFEDDAQFAQLKVQKYTAIEPAAAAVQGKRAARILFHAVPAGIRDYPAVVLDNEALRVHDFTPFEALRLSVLNPGPDDAELSLSIWDNQGNRGFPIPSTVTIKPGRWQQVQLRLASTDITNEALKLLQAIPNLHQLDLAGTRIDDAGLQHLALFPELLDLDLNSTVVSDRGINALLTIKGLRRVSLENARDTASGASYLKQRAPGLKLDLIYPWIWGERWSNYELSGGRDALPGSALLLQQLKDVTGLGYLHVEKTLLTPEFLGALKDLPRLEHLSFAGTSITDDSLAHLLGLSQVVRLDLSRRRSPIVAWLICRICKGFGN